MPSDHLDQRFFAGTRGQILSLLRRGRRSVEELAQALDLTGNAIRAHLTVLERDRLVQQQSVRRGVGKPTFVYRLTPRAERLFPKAYEPVLHNLLDALAERDDPAELEALLRAVGRRMAAREVVASGDIRSRLDAAVALLNDLGGLVELEENEETLSLCGYSCPLSPVVQSHPEMCKIMEAMLTEVIDAPVRERCERSESLSCWFEVPIPAP